MMHKSQFYSERCTTWFNINFAIQKKTLINMTCRLILTDCQKALVCPTVHFNSHSCLFVFLIWNLVLMDNITEISVLHETCRLVNQHKQNGVCGEPRAGWHSWLNHYSAWDVFCIIQLVWRWRTDSLIRGTAGKDPLQGKHRSVVLGTDVFGEKTSAWPRYYMP